LFVVALVATVVVVDVLFLKNHSYLRLAANIGIVLVFAAIYFRFLR
jgi:hypothetical protein